MYKLILGVLILGILQACTQVNANENYRFAHTSEQLNTFDASDVENVFISASVGEFNIVGTSSNIVTAKVELGCKKDNAKCETLKENLGWRIDHNSDTLRLTLEPQSKTKYSNVKIKVLLEIPSDKNVDLDINVGDVSVEDINGCINAQVDIGKLTVTSKKDIIKDIVLKADVGSTNLDVAGNAVYESRKSLVGSTSQWSGDGRCYSKIATDIGEVSVALIE